MPEIVIDKMAEFPNNITVNKPVPGERCFNNCIFFEKAYAKNNYSNCDKPANYRIKNKRKK